MKKIEMITIDGAAGEGGGQILRTSLTLSMATGKSFRIDGIRAKRKNPGLLRQHLTAVQAAQRICGANVEGGTLGSSSLTFHPGPVRSGEYRFTIGTAGSTTLIFQTLAPVLWSCRESSRITLEGGTHNPSAPCYDFLKDCYLPLLKAAGACLEADIDRRGFYPAGGGRWSVRIDPVRNLQPIDLTERGNLVEIRARAISAKLPEEISQRELGTLCHLLGLDSCKGVAEVDTTSPGPGNILLCELRFEKVVEMFTVCGEVGLQAEAVAALLAEEVLDYQRHPMPVGPHLADQLMIALLLLGGGSYRTGPLSPHAYTNVKTINSFVPGSVDVNVGEGRCCSVTVRPFT